MAKGIEDLGNGLGYVYITDTSNNIISALENTKEVLECNVIK